MRSSPSERVWYGAEGLAVVACGLSVWLLAGAPEWAVWFIWPTCAASLVVWQAGGLLAERRLAWHPGLTVAAAVTLVVALQLIPLPDALLRFLSPLSFEARQSTLLPLGLTAWRPVSVDAPSTWRALAGSLGLVCLATVGLQLGRHRPRRRRMLVALAVLGLSVVASAAAHAILDTPVFLGLHRFNTSNPLVTPFGNANHLAAFLGFTSTLTLGLAATAERDEAKVGWALTAVMQAVFAALALSRGGLAFTALSWAAFAAYLAWQRGTRARTAVLVPLAGVAVVLGGVALGYEQLLARVATVSTLEKLKATKVSMWPELLDFGLASWPLGVGRGAFEVAFPQFQRSELHSTLTHPENLVFQYLGELGAPVTVALAAAVPWLLVGWWRRQQAGVLGGAAAVALLGVLGHDVFDFALELPGLAAPVALTAGLLLGSEEGLERRGTSWASLAASLGAAGAIALCLWLGFPTHRTAHRVLAAEVEAHPEAAVDLARPQLDRHPSDWLLHAMVARAVSAKGSPQEGLAWANRVLRLRPADGPTHVSAAQALLRLGRRQQALVELKLASAQGDGTAVRMAADVARDVPEALAALGDEPSALEALVAALDAAQKPALATEVLEGLLEEPLREAQYDRARELRAARALDARDAEVARRYLEALSPAARDSRTALVLRARLAALAGQHEEAAQVLTRLFQARPQDLTVAWQLFSLHLGAGRPALAREVVSRARPFLTTGDERASLFQWEAQAYASEGQDSKALDALETAARAAPQRADLHYLVGQTAERLGLYPRALTAVREGREVDSPEGARSRDAWVQRLESAIRGDPGLAP